jgi:isoleucyl-tRNA synthetase
MYSPQNELKWLAFWKQNKTFEKSVEARPKTKQYVFYDGPPFATGTPHQGHILGLTIKDVFPRYHTMLGKRVERKWGWDCHGLPIENIVEKKLGLKNKKQIEEMGVGKFNQSCRAQVLEYAHEWGKTVDRMGKWIEFENAYQTMDQSYMETVWWGFKKLYDEGHVYEGKKILMYCPRCQTPLAKAEIQMDNSYKNVTETALTVKFKLKKMENTFALAWTTTPWTLIGNAALALNEKLEYVKIKIGNEIYILAKSRLNEIKEKYESVETFSGKKIVGMEYEPLYKIDSPKKAHYIVDGGDEVSSEEGTGIVHIAAYGEFDYELIKKNDLPLFTHVGDDGMIRGGHADWHGMWFKKADPLVSKELEQRNLVYKKEPHTHSYPFCYRCETPLFYNPVDSWFVRIQNVKNKLLERNNEIKWVPEGEGKSRFVNILETAPDWTVSRNRYWATALPVWKCTQCAEMKIIGSVKELQQHAMEKVPADVDLHKHVVDNIHLKCVCGSTMNRIPEVIDCWFESGAMPYASKHYPFENEKEFAHYFPADFVSEYVAQVRAWFYYMHVLGVALFDKAPFKNVVVSGNILAGDGGKMSKSKGNSTDPSLLFEKFGADAVRFYLMNSPVTQAQDVNFKDDGVQEVYRKVILLLANTLSFYEMYANDNSHVENPHSQNILDQWIVIRLNQTIEQTTTALNEYSTVNACRALASMIDDLSTWYLRRSRERFKGDDAPDKANAIRTLAHVLNRLSTIMAPITPFISEEIHQTLRKNNAQLKESVHLEDWPTIDSKLMDMLPIQNMAFLRNAVRLTMEQRDKLKIPVRQPLNEATGSIDIPKEYLAMYKDEVNVKSYKFAGGPIDGKQGIELDTTLTPELIAEGAAREFSRAIQELRKQAKLNPTQEVDVFVEFSPALQKMLHPHLTEIQNKVRARSIKWEKPSQNQSAQIEVTIKDEKATLSLSP